MRTEDQRRSHAQGRGISEYRHMRSSRAIFSRRLSSTLRRSAVMVFPSLSITGNGAVAVRRRRLSDRCWVMGLTSRVRNSYGFSLDEDHRRSCPPHNDRTVGGWVPKCQPGLHLTGGCLRCSCRTPTVLPFDITLQLIEMYIYCARVWREHFHHNTDRTCKERCECRFP